MAIGCVQIIHFSDESGFDPGEEDIRALCLANASLAIILSIIMLADAAYCCLQIVRD